MSQELPAILRENIKHKMDRGEVVVSLSVRLVRTQEIAYIAAASGFDTLYVDMKHNSFTLESVSAICVAAATIGVTPLVRVANNSPEEISRVLDAGALGVKAPQVRSVEDVRRVVEAAKFPPTGERSVASNPPQLAYKKVSGAETARILNEATVVGIVLETREGLENIDQIAEVEGLDLVSIGTNDLTAELGIPGEYDHPDLREAYKRTISACRDHGVHVGVGGLTSRPDLISEFVGMGARYISAANDLAVLLSGAKERAAKAKDAGVGAAR